VTVLADSAYGTGEFRTELAERGHLGRVEPAPVPRIIPGGFTVDDFTVDHANRTATCPNGLTRPISRTGVATFGVACMNCPLQPRSTRSRDGKRLKVTPMTHGSAPSPGHRRQPQAALPRHGQKRPLAASPSRRAQLTPARQPRVGSRRHRLGTRLDRPTRPISVRPNPTHITSRTT
jgi:hypothetical protein